ncbi:MAG: hypothetical protein FD174_1517 [Geobacteraceae bacterium]|nr:MAG: hypothetical protein FD174_1517 [Geobacteraceae bacterium]
MARDKVILKISAAAAAFVSGDVSKEEKMKAARGDIPLSAGDLGAVLFFLSHDADTDIRSAARKHLQEMSEADVMSIVGYAGAHPQVLDVLARLHCTKEAIVDRLFAHPNIESRTLAFLAERNRVTGAEEEMRSPVPVEEEAVETEETGIDEESEEYKTKYQLAQTLGVAEKIKTALTGDKEWRSLLIKDANKLVSGSVVKNPRITEPEILAIAKSSVQNDEIMRVICANKEWAKNYQIRKALAENHKTPLPYALRFVASLTDKDLAAMAKSKNVSSVISTQARRIMLNKKKQ